MLDKHPLRQILIATREHWDCAETPPSIRENFLKIIQCGTPALGAEVYASRTEQKARLSHLQVEILPELRTSGDTAVARGNGCRPARHPLRQC